MQTDNDNRTNNVTEKCLDWLELVNTARQDSAKSQNMCQSRDRYRRYKASLCFQDKDTTSNPLIFFLRLFLPRILKVLDVTAAYQM